MRSGQASRTYYDSFFSTQRDLFNGRIEVIGMVVAAMPFSPRLGRAVSSGPIYSLLRTPQ